MEDQEQGTPIKEIRLTVSKSQSEVVFLQSKLKIVHATMTYMSTYYLVKFPEGTTETPVAPSAAGYQEEYLITFPVSPLTIMPVAEGQDVFIPKGKTCRRVVYFPCVDPVCNHTWIFFGEESDMKAMRESQAQRLTYKKVE